MRQSSLEDFENGSDRAIGQTLDNISDRVEHLLHDPLKKNRITRLLAHIPVGKRKGKAEVLVRSMYNFD